MKDTGGREFDHLRFCRNLSAFLLYILPASLWHE